MDEEGNVWAGTSVGLAMYDGTEWMVYDTSNSLLPSEDVFTIAVDGNIVWVGTSDGGLVRIEGEEWTIYNTGNSGLPANNVYEIAVDLDGVVWLGTGEATGLTSFD